MHQLEVTAAVVGNGSLHLGERDRHVVDDLLHELARGLLDRAGLQVVDLELELCRPAPGLAARPTVHRGSRAVHLDGNPGGSPTRRAPGSVQAPP